MKKVPKWKALMTAALAATLMAACGSGGTADGDGDDGDAAADGATTEAGAEGDPVYGGTLTVGIVGGGSVDTLDAHLPVSHPDEARAISLYDALTTFDVDHNVEMALAQEITPSEDAKTWTVELRPGLRFSDGTPITADDVVFTYLRITDPDDPKSQAEVFSTLDRDNLNAVDETTVEFNFTEAFVTFPEAVAHYAAGIVPEGYDPDDPVGSGAFAYESFTAGQQSSFVKRDDYWREGQPYVDELVIIDFPDDTARVNALLGGQVDAIDQLPVSQISIVEADPTLEVLESETGAWLPFTMRVDQEPFDDVRVRQAFRLMIDREQIISQVLDGHGSLGNDLYAPFDACYDAERPQRTQDIDEAKRLLEEAGQSDLTVELVTSSGAAGMVEAAEVFTQQALEAGVRIDVRKVDTGVFYGEDYLSWTFAQDFWFTRDFLPQAGQSGFPNSPYNETHWDHPEWQDLVNEANTTLDEDARCELIQKAQDIEFEEGGFIIWGFPNNVDAHGAHVRGFSPDKSGIPLTSYGFHHVWLDN